MSDTNKNKAMPPDIIMPANATIQDGEARRLGVELEFTGLDCHEVAAVIAKRFDGLLRQEDEYRYSVESTDHGRFVIELDSRYVHKGESPLPDIGKRLEDEQLGDAVDRGVRMTIGEVTRHYVPVEIVCPTIPIASLRVLDNAVADLRERGARGTSESLVYAFGLQINVEMPALDAGTILTYFRAYLVSAERLRSDIGVDVSRRVLPFCQPHPPDYTRLVLRDDYAPGLEQLIDDYLRYNPTRNRDLDMLPLFAFIDEPRVIAFMGEEAKIKARPALHYRLPDSRIEDPDWFIVTEWNRWAKSVERLAADPKTLTAVRRAYLRYLETGSWKTLTQEALAWFRS